MASGSSLHPEVQRLVRTWFGDTKQFVEMTLKCPLGQLTKDQIDKGRDVQLRSLASLMPCGADAEHGFTSYSCRLR